GQQASKGNGEKRHRELWPAYNVNAAPPQASTEGLFQQTRLIAPVIVEWSGVAFRPHERALYFMHYNFGLVHKTLRVTPAMETKS
ncbi:MAG: hypothetical protein WBQ19_06845, partial [Terriglobales bacterium]